MGRVRDSRVAGVCACNLRQLVEVAHKVLRTLSPYPRGKLSVLMAAKGAHSSMSTCNPRRLPEVAHKVLHMLSPWAHA